MRSTMRSLTRSSVISNQRSRRFSSPLRLLSVLLVLCAALSATYVGTMSTSASGPPRASKRIDTQSQSPTGQKEGTKSVAGLLNIDGGIKPGIDGAFDASGYQMLLGANGAPSFVPMSSGCTESWDNRFFSSGAEDVNGGEVNAIAVDGSDVYIGGSFTTVANITANRVAKWDGTSWSALGSASQNGVDSTVHAMALIGTDLYVAGVFIVASDSTQLNISANRIASWSTTSGTWSPLGSPSQNGADGGVLALAVSGTELYVGGSFTTTSYSGELNMSANHVAKWSPSQNTWSFLGNSSENGVDGQVNTLAVMDTDLYVGGTFTSASDGTQPAISANHVAKWNGTSWSPLGNSAENGVDATVWALAVMGTDVYAAGEFTTVSDASAANTPANSIARWDTTTGTWSLLGDPGSNGIQAPIYALAVSGTELYVGGDFMSASDGTQADKPTYRVARWSPGSNTWSPLGNLSTRNGVNNQVKALLASGTDIFVGGQFTNFSSALQVSFSGNRIIRWDTTASSFSALANSSQKGVNNQVQAVAVNGTDVYIGGGFTSVGNVRANGLAKWNGSSWSSLGSSNQNGVNGTVTALLWNGELIVGGTFTTASSSTQLDISANHIVKWNTTSPGTWAVFGSAAQNGLSGTNATVNAIVQRGTSYYIGGTFTTASDSTQVNMSARNVVRWRTTNPNTWSPLGNAAQNGVDDTVNAVVLGTDSDIYVGGLFGSASDSTQVNMAARHIARWNLAPNTPVWLPLGSATQNGVSDRVDAIAFSGSDLYAGGNFNTASSATQLDISVTKIARWSMASSTWSPLGTPVQNGMNDAVTAIAVRGSNLYVGGAFITANDSTQANMSANRIARWSLTSNTWSPLGSVDNGLNYLVNDLAVSGGDVYVGGYFTTAGGLPSSHFAHWISNNNPPVITADGPTTFCAGGNVTLTSSSATGNQWYLDGNPIGGATNQTYVASAVGNYAATTVDNGCTTDLSAATTVTLVPLSPTPTITPGGPTTFCTGGSITLTSSSATDNQWYRGGVVIAAATSQTYIATVSGDYTVRATPGDCTSAPSAATTVTVNSPPATPTITPDGPTTFCTGNSVTLTSSSAIGSQWYLDGNPIGGATNQAYTASASGSYTTTVTASGCSPVSSAATTVTVNPTPATPTITPGGPTTFCEGGSVTLTSSSASGNQWYLNGNPIGGATNQTYIASALGNYTTMVTASGCPSAPSTATTVTVNPTPTTPTIAPDGPTTFCEGGSVTLTSSSPTGNQWYLDGNPVGGATNQTHVASSSGSYTTIITTSGCSSSPSSATAVTVNPTPATPTITPDGPTTFCVSGSVNLTSSSATGNQWYLNGNPVGGATNQTYVATASGSYTTIVTANGCPTAPSTATTVTVNPTPDTPTITPAGPTTFCEGGSVTLTSSSDSDSGSQWYLNGNPIGGATNQAYTATASGNYTVYDTANGCASAPSAATTVTVNPIPATPTITPGGATTFCEGGSVPLTSSSASGNQWYLNGNPIGGATAQQYNAASSGDYTVTVTTSNCTSASSVATAVTANTAPTLTYATPHTVPFGSSPNITPTAASDNGTVTYQVLAGHGLTTAPTVNASGDVPITNAQPAGAHIITVRATDNCGAITDASFALQVQSPANVSGTKTVSGAFAPGSLVTYTVTLSNSTTSPQQNNPGNEFTDVLSSNLTLISSNATSGVATATVGTNTVTWNGSIAGSASVTITIMATLKNVPDGTPVSNQGTISYDADGNGTNEATRLTDDPSIGGASDPTSFAVGDNNNPPNAVDDTLPSVVEDSGTRTIAISSLLSNDTNGAANESGQTLTLTSVSNPVGGTVTSDANNVYFTLAADFNGTASFQYTITDNGTTNGVADPKSDTATVSFTVTGVNDAPVTENDPLGNLAEDAPQRTIPFSVLTNNDSRGAANESSQTLTVKTVSNPVGLTVSIEAGTVRFTPLPDYNGPASFQYTVEDNGTTNGVADPKVSATSGLVHFNITEVNDAPIAVNDTLPGIENSVPQTIPFATLTANDSKGPANESGQTLIVNTVSNPVGGTVTIVAGSVVFTPAANYSGSASFDYTVEDNGTTNGAADPKSSGTATVTFANSAVADTPSVTNANTNPNIQTTSGLVISRNPADGAEVTDFKITAISGGALFKNNGTTQITNGEFITFAEGNAGLKFTPGSVNGSFTVQASLSASDAGLNGGTATATITVNPMDAVLRFSSANYSVAESAGFKTITVERSGDTSQQATVDYATSDQSDPPNLISCSSPGAGFASSRCDFTTAIGTLRFAAGETSKTFNVLINQDNYVEGPETLSLTLSNPPAGTVFGVPQTATLQITDDAKSPATNPIDNSSNFVRALYHDILNREPDQPGLTFWTDNIEKCNQPARRPVDQTVAQCTDKQRESTAIGFFMSPEFQMTGGFVYHLYKGSLTGAPNYDGGLLQSSGRFPIFLEFMQDLGQISEGIVVGNQLSGAVVEANRNRLAAEFVLRPEFVAKYGGLNDTQYVKELFNTTGIAATAAQKQALVDGLTNAMETRASVLMKIVDGTAVTAESSVQFTTTYGQEFINQENRRVFVYMEYVGYLRRNPDAAGFVFWLEKLNQYNGDPFQAEMVRSFILSPEYRSRFGQP
jgi:hypothetical protein